ncbi:hypothetical protein [Bosea sp. RAC05]|uniref:hypothetical protein n=1 Tax=Bosea sp. RAC05 TaxID=1842539 RepID=UPI00083D6324|nr:hypothetical protein [Bosea sp. RAC05]AOG03134.1 hypothetical protein BSY19_4837 [Bosea sp. RAC05]
MAKVSEINQHDWMAVRTTFTDGTKANITWNYGGVSVSVRPLDPTRSEQLALIASQAWDRMAEPSYVHTNPGKQAKAFAEAARAALSLDHFLELSRAALQVTGERPKPRNAVAAPSTATVAMRSLRGGTEFKLAFPTGERIELKINKSSVGMRMDPPIQSRQDEILRAILTAKMKKTLDDEAIIEIVQATVPGSPDIATWQDEFIAGLKPAAAPRP